jgi:AcrR family transcriptional regulator
MGNKRITPRQKADILIQKEIGGMTNAEIAKKVKVSVTTVDHTSIRNQPDEVLKIYEKKKERLAEKALDVTLAALEKGEELIHLADNPKALAGIAQMGRFADTVHRLERGDPTQISQSVGTEGHALAFIRFMMTKMDQAAALEAFVRANLEPLVPEIRKTDIIRRIESGELKLLAANNG